MEGATARGGPIRILAAAIATVSSPLHSVTRASLFLVRGLDYLAVSLDHLRQTRLAADYYRRALDAAQGAATQFDPGPVARRLAELR